MKIHIVQKGDTLYEIAKSYHVDFDDIVKLNPQLSSPDMIMPGMKIKIPSESKQLKSNTAKEERVEKVPTEAKSAERPMGQVEGDDHLKKKEVKIKVPDTYEPLYPVKPINKIPPKTPYQNEMPMEKVEQTKDVKPIKHKYEEMKQEKQENIMPQTPYRPMGESESEMEKTMMCCCCRCGRPMEMPRQNYYPSPWHQKGTCFYGNPFMPQRMNNVPHHYQMNQMPHHHLNRIPQQMNETYNFQMNQMANEQMNHRNKY